MKKKWWRLLLILGCLTFLAGCWDKRELTDLAIVNAVGVDKLENGKFRNTFQIINPGNVAGNQQGGAQTSGIPITVYTVSGRNMLDAARLGSKNVSRQIYYAHANLVVIGEDLAREGLMELFDVMERDPQFRTTSSIVIAENTTAEDLLKMLTPIDKLPANKITKTLKFTEKALGENMDVSVDDVIRDMVSPGKEPVISGFKIVGNSEAGKEQANLQTTEAAARLQAGGMAIFKEGKLTRWLHGKNARGVLWVQNKVQQTPVNINWKNNNKPLAFFVIRGKSIIKSKLEKNKPVMKVHIEAEGDIREADIQIDLTNPNIIFQLEKLAEKEIKKEIMATIKMIQKEKTDVFGFGDVIHRTSPKVWKQLKNDWNDVGFPELKVDVDVDAFIRRTGLRNNPYITEVNN